MATRAKNQHVVTENEIAQFNMVRVNLAQKEMSRNELIEEFKKKMNYHMHSSFLKAITSGVNPPIIKISRGKYCVNPEPVHIARLQTVWDLYTKCANPRNYDDKGNYQQTMSIEHAIAILKQAGYKVYKPVTEFVEV